MKFPRLRQMRKEKGYTQAQVASFLGVDRRTYSSYENGVNALTAPTLILLSRVYGQSTDYLLGLSDRKNPVGH